MAAYRVNDPGVDKARELIDANQYDVVTEWSDGAPSTDEGNAMIDRHGYGGYGRWHLAIDVDASEETKDRYGFPYGDFHRVHRSALIHAKQRAMQYGHGDVAEAADGLLQHLDDRRA